MELAEDTLQEAADLEEEIKSLSLRIQELKREIAELWQDQHRAEYELVSVFIHRGALWGADSDHGGTEH